jgi:hypothetical protein
MTFHPRNPINGRFISPTGGSSKARRALKKKKIGGVQKLKGYGHNDATHRVNGKLMNLRYAGDASHMDKSNHRQQSSTLYLSKDAHHGDSRFVVHHTTSGDQKGKFLTGKGFSKGAKAAGLSGPSRTRVGMDIKKGKKLASDGLPGYRPTALGTRQTAIAARKKATMSGAAGRRKKRV